MRFRSAILLSLGIFMLSGAGQVFASEFYTKFLPLMKKPGGSYAWQMLKEEPRENVLEMSGEEQREIFFLAKQKKLNGKEWLNILEYLLYIGCNTEAPVKKKIVLGTSDLAETAHYLNIAAGNPKKMDLAYEFFQNLQIKGFGKKEIFQLLLRLADYQDENKTVVYFAARMNNLKMLELVRTHIGDRRFALLLSHVEIGGKNALIAAARSGFPETVEYLLYYNHSGLVLEQKDIMLQKNALEIAIYNLKFNPDGREEVIEILKKAYAKYEESKYFL